MKDEHKRRLTDQTPDYETLIRQLDPDSQPDREMLFAAFTVGDLSTGQYINRPEDIVVAATLAGGTQNLTFYGDSDPTHSAKKRRR